MNAIKTILVYSIILLAGCSTLPLDKARKSYNSGNLQEAESLLGVCDNTPKRDLLLCYMDKGLILHYLGQYELSSRYLLKASRLMVEQDQVSITDQSSGVLLNDKVTTYKGEYSERLWVHTFLMMNFLLQDNYEGALVEAKLALELYERYQSSLDHDYFTRALAALSYENMNQPDDARIEYDRLAKLTGKEVFKSVFLKSDESELILFIAQDRIPKKVSKDIIVPPGTRISLPVYSEAAPARTIHISQKGQPVNFHILSANWGDISRTSLKNRYAGYIARHALRTGSREMLASAVGGKNEIAEVLIRAIFILMEQADTRSWAILPGTMSIIRILLHPGTHMLTISSGNSGEDIDIQLGPGQRKYRSIRF